MAIFHLNCLCNPASEENKTLCGVFLPDLYPNWTSCFIFHLLTGISGNKMVVNKKVTSPFCLLPYKSLVGQLVAQVGGNVSISTTPGLLESFNHLEM